MGPVIFKKVIGEKSVHNDTYLEEENFYSKYDTLIVKIKKGRGG